MDVSDIVVETGSQAAGKQMKEISFPHDCVVASVRRGAQFFIPRGETILYPGDILVMVAEGTAYEEALKLCHRPDGIESPK
jgi:Trk K+ transport system NAD-binding subunit